MSKKLKVSNNKMILGVAGGLAEYLDMDPSLARIIVVVAIFFTGLFPGLVLYFIFALIMKNN